MKGPSKKTEAESASVAAKRAKLAYILQSGGTHGDGKSTLKTPGDKRTPGQRLYQVG